MAYYPLGLSLLSWDNFVLFQRELYRFYNCVLFLIVDGWNRVCKRKVSFIVRPFKIYELATELKKEKP